MNMMTTAPSIYTCAVYLYCGGGGGGGGVLRAEKVFQV